MRPDPTTMHKIIEEFGTALYNAGFQLMAPPIMDGKIHRCRVEDDKPGRKSGSYVGYLDGHPAGLFNNFKTSECVDWKSSTFIPSKSVMTSRNRRQSEREVVARQVASSARGMWRAARVVDAMSQHAYLVRKGIRPIGLKLSSEGCLLVPMRDAVGELQSLQRITSSGKKLFLAGGRTEGLHWWMPSPAWSSDSPILIAEGMSTAAKMAEALALPAVVAFTSDNLPEVSATIRRIFPERSIVIAGDNDGTNRAIMAAEAAAAVNGRVWLPSFQAESSGTDWNDFGMEYGIDGIRAAFSEFWRP